MLDGSGSALLSDSGNEDRVAPPPPPITWDSSNQRAPRKFRTKIGAREIEISTSRDEQHWIAYGADEINRLGKLPQDWDSYEAGCVSQSTLEQAIRVYLILTQNRSRDQWPDFSASPNGGITLLWQMEDRGLEVRVEGPVRVTAYYFDDAKDQEWIGDVSLGLESLHQYLEAIFG